MTENASDRAASGKSSVDGVVTEGRRRSVMRFQAVWIISTLILIAVLWTFAFRIEPVGIRFAPGGFELVELSCEETHLEHLQWRFRLGVCGFILMASLISAGLIRVFVSRQLSRWFSSHSNPALVGGWLLHLMVSIKITESFPVPEQLRITTIGWLLLVAMTYSWIVIAVIAALDFTEAKSSLLTRGIRAVVLSLIYGAGFFACLAVVGVLCIKALFILMRF